jgi:hypothetical protein
MRWVRGRGSGRFGLEPDADLNYAASSADAGVGLGVLAVGIALQVVSALDSTARGTALLLAIPFFVALLALVVRTQWRRRREVSVIRIRIDELVGEKKWTPADWPKIAQLYSRALGAVGRGRRTTEDPWAHLDRIYGEDCWVPPEAIEGMRDAYETSDSITDR